MELIHSPTNNRFVVDSAFAEAGVSLPPEAKALLAESLIGAVRQRSDGTSVVVDANENPILDVNGDGEIVERDVVEHIRSIARSAPKAMPSLRSPAALRRAEERKVRAAHIVGPWEAMNATQRALIQNLDPERAKRLKAEAERD